MHESSDLSVVDTRPWFNYYLEDQHMNAKLVISALVAALALSACAKQEEAAAPAPEAAPVEAAPVAEAAADAATAVEGAAADAAGAVSSAAAEAADAVGSAASAAAEAVTK